MYHQQETEDLLMQLASIPAPSGREDLRVAFIKDWLEKIGCEDVCVDEAKNVIYTYHPELPGPVDLFCAHTDVVFDDMAPLPMVKNGDLLTGPGCGDDTASLVVMLLALRELRESGIIPQRPMVFVANSGEEGLGNLKGSRQLVASYQGRLHSFTSFDALWGQVVDTAVGSERFRISCRTTGGHSFRDFGSPSAIVDMASLISLLSRQQVPDSMTTFNVGTISGGTSVNSIAGTCEITYEYRATSKESMELMRQSLESLIAECAENGLHLTVEPIGSRPTGKLDTPAQKKLASLAERVIRHGGGYPVRCVGSNDCNIPLSCGIPSVCIGVYEARGAHTRKETVRLSSLKTGFRAVWQYFQQIAQGALDW